MKFLILMAYYDRPNMVKTALQSVLAQGDAEYHLAIVDDCSEVPVGEVLKDFLWDISDVTIYNTKDTADDKIFQGGSRFGSFWNKAMRDSDADVALMLCDDDALMPGHLNRLAEYYEENPMVDYSYGHVLTYDPSKYVDYKDLKGGYDTPLNNHNEPIDPFCKVDASQVSWRLPIAKEARAIFPSPQTVALDAAFYAQLYNKLGPCPFNGLFTQFKGVFPDQLGNRSDFYSVKDSV